jgi:uncharacterized membrane protein
VSRAGSARRREENEVEFSRIVAFSDGVFAIAITLLVLNLAIPEHLPKGEVASVLWSQRQDAFAYAFSFAVIGRFWLLHHRFFGEVTGFDGRLIALNLFYLAWIVLIPFTGRVLGDYGGVSVAVALYAANLAAAILASLLLSVDAQRSGLVRAGGDVVREGHRRAVFGAAVFLLSIPLAFVAPNLAPFAWLALFAWTVVDRPRRPERAARG